MSCQEVPPLEDVPEVMDRIKDLNLRKEVKSECSKENVQQNGNTKMPRTTKTKGSFGGMKKGFLFASDSPKPVKTKPKSVKSNDDIPMIRPQEQSSLVIKEVQEAMEATNSDQSMAYTDDVAARLASHPTVADVIADPAWLLILEEFQTNPEAASIKYKNHANVKATMKELCSVLGDSFLTLPKNTKTEEEKLAEGLQESPVVKDSLTDPFIQKMMLHMKEGTNDEVQQCLQNATPQQKSKIQVLIDHGLLSFDR